jgi:hypothetical protein
MKKEKNSINFVFYLFRRCDFCSLPNDELEFVFLPPIFKANYRKPFLSANFFVEKLLINKTKKHGLKTNY